ncbi:hypothetical protein B296_00040445 [Ensete ventricosum]|uniref:Uncharacterized protein n=1 Tax=Ensete ventricosum TaxID=4639 RepID=A0A426XGZ1_ENSVE|nr:hypothetical protein B296_00040445 [Ensete ventricosum]
MAWVFPASRLECDVEVFVMHRPLPDLGSPISLSRGGAVTARGWPIEDYVDLLLDRTFGILERVVGDRSISDQKNLDVHNPIKNAWMARDGWRSGIPWTCEWCRMIGCRSRVRSEPDRRSDFATELAPEPGKLHELPGLGAVVAPPQVRGY